MRHTHPATRLLALTAALGLSACQPGAPQPAEPAAATVVTAAPVPQASPTPDSDEPLLRTYTVPPEQARAIERALASALRTGKDLPPLGTVERLPDGSLLVVAPPGVQDGIAALVGGLDPTRVPPVRTAEFDYWIILAEPAELTSGLDGIPDIAPALQAITATHGPLKFSLFETMRLSSLLDERGEADGNRMKAQQTISEVGGHLIADIEVSVGGTLGFICSGNSCKRLKSRLHLEPDQLLVVGQTGFASDDGKKEADSKTMFHIVRGRLRTGGA